LGRLSTRERGQNELEREKEIDGRICKQEKESLREE